MRHMTTKLPGQRPEGKIIQEALKADGRSVRKVAAQAGISEARWRQVVKGSIQVSPGVFNEVVAPPATLARMAHAVGVTPEQLAETGRTDAADLLERMGEDGTAGATQGAALNVTFTAIAGGTRGDDMDEIDMIVDSTMSPERKLRAIRQVLLLRAQAQAEQAEEARARAQQEAPAPDAEASVEQG
jgi:transcriptional regulator with XRE-family HTH domain